MPCRSLSLALAVASAGLAADFPLEDYVPADFHRQYLSVAPDLSFDLRGNEERGREPGLDYRARGHRQSLRLNHGARRRSRPMDWDLSTGASLGAHGGDNTSINPSRNASGRIYESDQEGEWHTFNYAAFARLEGKRYLPARFFLGASGGADFDHRPLNSQSSSGWRLEPPGSFGGDTATFSRFRSDGESRHLSASGTLRLAAGYGRLEDVTFAETGMFLLDRFAEVTGNRIRLSRDGMRDLEAFVEARRKQRGFHDARRAAIFDLESVDLFLREKGGMGTLPARAVLEMADEWRHARRVKRESGWEARLQPFVRVSWAESRWEDCRRDAFRRLPADSAGDPASLRPDPSIPEVVRLSEQRTFRGERAFGAGLHFARRRPIRRFYQLDADAWTRFSLEQFESGRESRHTDRPGDNSGGRFVEYAYPQADLGVSVSAAWLPSTRTLIRATLYDRTIFKSDYLDPVGLEAFFGPDPEQSVVQWSYGLRLDAERHLSDRLTLHATAHFGSGGRDSRDEVDPYILEAGLTLPRIVDEETLDASVNLGLTYYVF